MGESGPDGCCRWALPLELPASAGSETRAPREMHVVTGNKRRTPVYANRPCTPLSHLTHPSNVGETEEFAREGEREREICLERWLKVSGGDGPRRTRSCTLKRKQGDQMECFELGYKKDELLSCTLHCLLHLAFFVSHLSHHDRQVDRYTDST